MADDMGRSGRARPADDRDWATELTDRLEQVVGRVRAQTTDRLLRIARIIVFGLVVAVIGVVAVVLLIVGLVRVVDIVVPQEVWLAYLILGGLFTVVGVLLWSKRKARPQAER